MSREILFRGQTRRKGEKVYMGTGKPVEGNWVYGGITQGKGDFSVMYSDGPVEKHVVYTDTVGQFTGLTDKNGKKIFEGDIVSEKPPMNKYNFVGKVVWDEQRGAWRFFIFEHPDYVAYLATYGVEYTVIGNIHDNPELLEVE